MRVFITIPSFAIHGGIRIILEWANRLAASGHEVYLRALRQPPPIGKPWFTLDPRVRVVFNDNFLGRSDLLIVTSPHAAHYLDKPGPARKIIFLQMMEHLFHPGNPGWMSQCLKLYRSPHPIITISLWNWQMLLDDFGRAGPVHYVGNGVNFEHFPIRNPAENNNQERRNAGNSETSDSGAKGSCFPNSSISAPKTVLIEGINGNNPTKDPDNIAVKVGLRIAEQGYRVLSYGLHPIPVRSKNWEFHWVRPNLADLNSLYERATILLKASRFDARACAPVEAMAKGVPTVRAIVKGDDDLLRGHNCLKVDYEQNALSLAALRLLEDDKMRAKLSAECLEHVKRFSWAHWWPIIERILTTNGHE